MNRRLRPFQFRDVRDEMDRMMTNLLPGWPDVWGWERDGGRAFPALNVWEQGDELLVEAELPGLKSDQIDISVMGDELTVKGAREESAPQDATWHRHERGLGPFTRVVKLPVEVDPNKVRASLQDGVLLITLTKAESAKPRKIPVAAQSQ